MGRTLFLVVVCLVLLISMETASVVGDDKGVKENDGKDTKEIDNKGVKDDAKAQKETDDKVKKEQEAKAKKEKEDAKAKKDAEEKAKKEAEAKAKKEKEDAKAKKDAEAKAKKEAEAKAKKEKEDAKAKKEAEAKAKKEAEAKAKKEKEDAKAKKEAEAKAKKEAEAKAKKEKEDAKAKKDAEAKAKKEAEAKAKKEKEEAKAKQEAEAKAKKEAEAKAKQQKEEAKATTQYTPMAPVKGSNRERGYCQAKGRCNKITLECPKQCPERKPKNNKKVKGCFIDCSSKCETTCKYRRPKCDGYGSLCYDPRFVGGDGVMFYFHGITGGDFALVSDDDFQINAHFIGTRPVARTRDYTWVQALSVMFDSHNLVLAAKKISHWDDSFDALIVRWDGETVEIPTDGEAEWRTNGDIREVAVERTENTNSVRVVITGLVEMYVKVTPIGAQENKAHNYQLPSDDAFAHLETQFKFVKLTDSVEGVLGKTYQPNYVSPVKIGVPMPMMGGEDKYRTPSLLSPTCKACRFEAAPSTTGFIREVVEY